MTFQASTIGLNLTYTQTHTGLQTQLSLLSLYISDELELMALRSFLRFKMILRITLILLISFIAMINYWTHNTQKIGPKLWDYFWYPPIWVILKLCIKTPIYTTN